MWPLSVGGFYCGDPHARNGDACNTCGKKREGGKECRICLRRRERAAMKQLTRNMGKR